MSFAGYQEGAVQQVGEPVKKRWKAEQEGPSPVITCADLCRVVMENDSSSEDEAGDSQSSTDEEPEDSENEDIIEEESGLWSQLSSTRAQRVKCQEINFLKVAPVGPLPKDYFSMMMNRSMLSLIIRNTNANAATVAVRQQASTTPYPPTPSLPGPVSSVTAQPPTPRLPPPWKPVKEEEMRKFIGLFLFMGVVKLPSISMYWGADSLLNFPSFRKVMPKERFLSIFHALYYCDDSVAEVGDPVKKIRPIVEFFNILMESIYSPQHEIVIDNPLPVPRDRREKPRASVDLFTLCESSGLVLKLLVQKRTRVAGVTSSQKKRAVVMDLLEGKLGRGYSLFTGDYFTSLPLLHSLKMHNTYCTGLVVSGRTGNSQELLKERVKNGETTQRFTTEGICMLKSMDKGREVLIMSSEFDGSIVKVENDEANKKLIPHALQAYNKYMLPETYHGNNRLQDMITYYPSGKKHLKWYRKVGLHLINVMLLNAFHLYNKYTTKKPMSLLKFRLSVVKSLLGISMTEKASFTDMGPSGNAMRPHVLDYVGRNEKGFRKRKRCKYCISEKGVRVDSYYQCITCENQPGFCLGQCFIKYHKYDLIT